MKILYVISDGFNEFNSSNFRARIPVNAINKTDYAQARIVHSGEWLKQTEHIKALCHWADVITIQRVAIFEGVTHTETWRNKGKCVVVDFDDAYQLIRGDNASYDFWGNGYITKTTPDGVQYKVKSPNPVEQFKLGVSKVSAIVTPSELLCKDWAKHLSPHSTSLHIPNYIEGGRYLEPFDKNRIIIGWGGSLSHLPSWTESGVINAIYKLMKKHDNLYLMIVGDERVVDKLSILPKDRLMFHPYVIWQRWPEMLRLFDIGIAPLAGEYDCRRSDLKVSEYIASSLPFVATKSDVYKRYFELDGFVEQGDLDKCDKPNADGWYHALDKKIVDIKQSKEQAKQAKRDYWASYNITENTYNIVNKYKEIL